MRADLEPYRKLYANLRAEVIGVYYRRRLITQLFTSSETNDLLNRTAIRFFTTLKWDLMDAIVIAISRLIDPPKSRNKYLNASLQQLIDSIEASAKPQLVHSLKDIFAQIKVKAVRIENWRKKWAAHRDYEVVRGQTPRPAISLPEINEVLVLIRKFMNEFERAYLDKHIEINLYEKTVTEVAEIAESENLKIYAPIDYENITFQDDGNTLLALIHRASSLT